MRGISVEAQKVKVIGDQRTIGTVKSSKNNNELVDYYCSVSETGFEMFFYFFASTRPLDLEPRLQFKPIFQQGVKYPHIRKGFFFYVIILT